jgi:hypothetical protein
MNRRLVAAAVATLTVTASLAAASPAHAYDADAYAFAAGHQISASDIPGALGTYGTNPSFVASPSTGKAYLCQVPTVEASAVPTIVQYPGPKLSYSTTYNGTGGVDAPGLTVEIDQYASEANALKAFTVASRRIVVCTGTGTSTYTDPTSGAVSTFTSSLSHGLVKKIESGGVRALSISTDSLSQTTPGDPRVLNDSYAIVWLVGDTVMTTTYYQNTNENITPAQRKAVANVALAAQREWVE